MKKLLLLITFTMIMVSCNISTKTDTEKAKLDSIAKVSSINDSIIKLNIDTNVIIDTVKK